MAARILVVGAGAAGLALAIGLEERGLACEVVEHAHALAPVGGGIILHPNALRCLDRLGVGGTVRTAGIVGTEAATLDLQGRVVARWDWREVWDGEAPVNIARQRLVQTLAEAVNGPIRMGVALTAVQPVRNQVEVAFSDRSRGTYDLVVGADGVHSTIRRLAFASLPPRYVGQHYWRGLVPDPAGEVARHGWILVQGPDRFFGLTPVGHGQVHFFGQLNADTVIAEPPEGRLAHARSVFADFPAPVTDALARLTDDTQLHFGPVDEVVTNQWRSGRVILVGDAAHACSPVLLQGGALALEDAVVLAALLPGEIAECDAALDAFVARRQPRATWVRERTYRFIARAIQGQMLPTTAAIVSRYRDAYSLLKSPP